MAFRKTLGLLITLLFSINIWADNIKINPDHPDKYTVVKGDTLWDISGQFLEQPWQWPQLWNNNPQIKNPDLIYPGDTLHFSVVDGKPRLSFSDRVTLKPRIRTSPLDQAIKLIPTDAIAQFLTSPKVVNDKILENSPYVIDFAGEHMLAGAGDRIYVRSILNPKSLSYTIYRAGEAYVSPDNPDEILGYEAEYIADATIERSGDPATLNVTKSDIEIRKGDRLMVSAKSTLALNYFPRPPEKTINGSIISVLNGVSEIGQHNIVVIDRGTADGLKPGHTLDIYNLGTTVDDPFNLDKDKQSFVKLPDEIAGELMVFRSFERVSYALVLVATRAIHVFDRIHSH